LLDEGVPVDAAYANQLTALMWAAGAGSVSTVKLLLERGARSDLRDDRGLTALEMARQAGHSVIVELLGPH
jgi:ankyrin repeat protein